MTLPLGLCSSVTQGPSGSGIAQETLTHWIAGSQVIGPPFWSSLPTFQLQLQALEPGWKLKPDSSYMHALRKLPDLSKAQFLI